MLLSLKKLSKFQDKKIDMGLTNSNVFNYGFSKVDFNGYASKAGAVFYSGMDYL